MLRITACRRTNRDEAGVVALIVRKSSKGAGSCFVRFNGVLPAWRAIFQFPGAHPRKPGIIGEMLRLVGEKMNLEVFTVEIGIGRTHCVYSVGLRPATGAGSTTG